MAFRPSARVALHWLLIITMIATSLAVPARAMQDAVQATIAASMAQAMAEIPCGDMDAPSPAHEMPCDCCTPASCDLSACLGNACLPELPRIVAAIPPMQMPVPWTDPAPPPRWLDTPFRPPIV